MKKLRWGVIGAGGIADRRTIPGMMLANNAELIAVMEINMELAEKSRAKWGCKRAYDSEAALLADPEIDAVYIASPVVLHAKQAMMAADAGKHILIEKPLAMTSEEGQKVVDYCESKGVKIAAGLMMRFGAYVMAMKQAIADGKIGRPVSGFSQFTCWYPDMPGNWRQSKKNGGGGAMMDMGVHCIDLMQYVTGSKVKQVAAFHDTLTFHYEVEDTSTVLMRLENGCECVVQSNFNIPDEASKWRLEFFGDQGHLVGENIIGQIDGGTLDAMFCGEVGGYDTYRYYDGNTLLRSWICMPLIVGLRERCEGTVRALLSPELLTDDGLLTEQGGATFWDRSTLYALRGIYNAGYADRATEMLHRYSQRRLLGDHVPYPIEAWPEGSQRHLSAESGLYCRIVTEGLFGIRPAGLRSFDLTPGMPSAWERMSLRRIRAFDADFDISVGREVGGKLRITVMQAGKKPKIYRAAPGATIRVKLTD